MADRYLRASGNWNGPVWAATSGGAAGSASTPTASDTAYIAANFTVTLTADAQVGGVRHTNGTLSLSSYRLRVNASSSSHNFVSSGSTARTINLGSGVLEVLDIYAADPFAGLVLSGSNLTLNAGTSLVILNVYENFDFNPPFFPAIFYTAGKTFNDVRINMGTGSSPTTLNITGSPTFRSLMIQSKNSAAHTVNLDDGANIFANKFIAIGSSTANRLKIYSPGWSSIEGRSYPSPGFTSYGQFVNIENVQPVLDVGPELGNGPPYIGSNSITNSGWLLQDPPKISTFTDSMTSNPVDNTNWHFTGLVQQITSGIDGGGYLIGPQNASLADSATTTGVFDFTNSEIVIEKPNWNLPPEERYYTNSALGVDLSLADFYLEVFEFVETSGTSLGQYGQVIASAWLGGIDIYKAIFDLPIAGSKYVRIKHGGGVIMYSVLDDNGDWHDMHSIEVSAEQELHLRAARLYIRGTQKIGSINILPEPPAPTSQGSFLSFF